MKFFIKDIFSKCDQSLFFVQWKYYTDLKMLDSNENENVWKNVKPSFSNKFKGNKTISLVEMMNH